MAVSTNYAQPILPSGLTYDENATYNMVEKIARQVIRNVTTEDRLAIFDKVPINDGTTIEEAVVGLAEATSYDKDAVDVFVKTNPNMYVRYYKNWTPLQYATTAQINEIRKVMLTGGNAEDLAERIAGALVESDKQDKYERTKGLLKWATTNNGIVKVGTLASDDYKGILTALKNTVSGMTFVNTNYNVAQIKRRTRLDDIVILMPYTVKNAIDVEELAGVFNLSKAEIGSRIIEIDGDETNIYIVDRQALLIYTRLYEMSTLWNPKGLYMNYWLTNDRLYALSPLFDACYIQLTAGTGANAQKVVVTNTTSNPVNTKTVS